MSIQQHRRLDLGHCAIAIAITAVIAASGMASTAATAAAAGDDPEAATAQAAWQETIANTPLPSEGCFQADFPSTEWAAVDCVEAPLQAYFPTTHSGLPAETVGDGHDYAASVTNLITNAKGSFPSVTGVTSENDNGESNVYSLQLNSNFMKTKICNNHPNCLSWQQFVYSSGFKVAFMQYWLIGWDAACPGGWTPTGSDCFTNSAAVAVPQNPIGNLAKESLYGSATGGGSDKVLFTGPLHAYSVTGPDSKVYLATGWRQAEFNIFGDGNSSEADFNSGSHVTVRVLVHHQNPGVLSCASNAGTTAETNNLNLGGSCTVVHGSNPYIQFTESN